MDDKTFDVVRNENRTSFVNEVNLLKLEGWTVAHCWSVFDTKANTMIYFAHLERYSIDPNMDKLFKTHDAVLDDVIG